MIRHQTQAEKNLQKMQDNARTVAEWVKCVQNLNILQDMKKLS